MIKTVPKVAQVKIMEYFKQAAEPVNGWTYLTKNIGVYGTDYIQRALVTAIGLGANRPQDAIYPTSQKDADGKRIRRRFEEVRHALRQRPNASGQRLLVADHV